MDSLKSILRKQDEDLEVDIHHVKRVRSEPGVQVIDCREPNEWAAGHMAGTTLIPLGSLAVRKGELDPSLPVVIVCRSGNRSMTAAKMLVAAGFVDAKSMAGGLIAWVNDGQELAQ